MEAADETCVFVYVRALKTDEYVLSVSVCLFVWIAILALALYAFCLELDTRDKRLHICACMSRITCSIQCVPPTHHPPIICLSLSVLFNLFLVSAQWLPLTVSPSQM